MSDKNLRYCLSPPSFQNNVTITILVVSGFPQHIMCFVVHGLPHRWSMSGTVERTLCEDVARN